MAVWIFVLSFSSKRYIELNEPVISQKNVVRY
jgi:hypothetical protein